MIEHADYCPERGDSYCDCDWEARVRADERAKVYRPDAHQMMLERDAARAEVERLRSPEWEAEVRADERAALSGKLLTLYLQLGDMLNDYNHAEAVAAKLVEVICDRESDYRNALWELGVAHDMHDAVTEVLNQTRAEVGRVMDERDAARAEVEAWKRIAQVTQNDLDESASTAVRWYDDLQEARAEVAALHLLAQKEATDAFASGRRDTLADLRAKVEGLPLAAAILADETGKALASTALPDTASRSAVLALIEEAQND